MKRSTSKRCPYCGDKDPSHNRSLCFVQNEEKIRSNHRPRVGTIEDAYVDGRLRSELICTDIERKLMTRQREKAVDAIMKYEDLYEGDVPLILRLAAKSPPYPAQVSHQKPWAVMWLKKDGTRGKKSFNNLAEAAEFHLRALKVTSSATIVSLNRMFDMPTPLILRLLKKREAGKLPATWKWCPRCVKMRKFHRVQPQVTFMAEVKIFVDGYWSYTSREVALMECPLCGLTNRNPIYRRNNQPWLYRKFKHSSRRAKRRVRR